MFDQFNNLFEGFNKIFKDFNKIFEDYENKEPDLEEVTEIISKDGRKIIKTKRIFYES